MMTYCKFRIPFAFRTLLRGLFAPLVYTCLVLCALTGCKKEEAPVRGQLMVVLQTDMSLPKDVTQVKILVKRSGTPYHDKTYIIAPGENWLTKLPATLAVVANVDDPTPVVEVTVVGLKKSDARVFAQAVTTIPENRTATLFVPVQWLCDDSVRVLPGNAGYASTCDPKDGKAQACRVGTCTDVRVDEKDLKDYDPSDVFGGADDPKDGLCFPTVECFAEGFRVTPDDKCIAEVPVPEGLQVNFALFNPKGVDSTDKAGICSDEEEPRCYVPLDQDADFGWTYVKGSSASSNPVRAQLPKAVCAKLAAGDIEAVHATWDCNVKKLRFPTCGPWSAVDDEIDVDPVTANPPPSDDAGPVFPSTAALVINFAEPGSAVEIGRPVELQLTVVLEADAGTVDVTQQASWSSTNEQIASVSQGVVTGHRVGTAQIQAELNGAVERFDITVERGTPESLELMGGGDAIPVGLTQPLTVQANYPGDNLEDATEVATWTSADETVATVDDEGVVKGVAEGITTVTAELNGTSQEIEIVVGPPVLTALRIFGLNQVGPNQHQVVVHGTYSDNPDKDDVDITALVTWEQTGGEEYATLDETTGILTVTDVVPDGGDQVRVKASLGGFEDEEPVNIILSDASAE